MRLILIFATCIICASSFAQTNEIKRLEAERKQALIEISNTSKLLNDTKKNTSSLLSRISLLSDQIITRQRVLALLESEIKTISAEQERNEKEIAELEKGLRDKRDKYATAVNAVMRNRVGENKLLFVLSGKSLSESYRRFRYLKEYSTWQSSQADEIKEKSDTLKEKKQLLSKTKAEKIALLKQREAESNKLKEEESTYQGEVKEAQQKQKELQKTLAQKQKQADALNKKIENLIAEEVARQEREAKRKNQARAEAETKANAENGIPAENTKPSTVPETITKEDFKLSSDFASNKGRLPFPVTGAYTISSRFGVHKHKEWNVTTSSNGIVIKAQAGAQVRAVFDGVVTSIFAVQGYYNNIIVRHGNYYTVYSNIQHLYIKLGDSVTTGQVLGLIYNDPETNISETDFQLFKGTIKMDPEPWLKR